MNFGRQLKRVKQQADHLFLRSDRTDVVGELRAAEEHVEEVRVLCEAYTSALHRCLHTHTTPDEKKLKKVPQYQAAEALKEGLNTLPSIEHQDHQDLLRNIVGRVVEVEQALGMDVVEFEDSVEKQVLDPLSTLIKDDLLSLAKQKKQLKQVGLDLDAAKTRYRSAQATPNPNPKTDAYREEMEDAILKLDQARDSYACDIFSVLAREREISKCMCGYLELQHSYLTSALQKLDRVLPDLKHHLDQSQNGPMYGVPLHEHLRITQQDIAVVLQVCVRHLIETGLDEEGLLRVAGSAGKVKRLKGAFDAGLVTNEALHSASDMYDMHVVAGALKCYLRELPEPLLTHVLHDQWLEAARQSDHQGRLRALWQVAQQLPPANLANLRYLVKFLSLLASYSAHNKMTPSNIAIVIAPNLIWASREPGEGEPDMSTLGRNMSLTADYRALVGNLVEYAGYFFKEDVDFGVTPRPPPSPAPPQVRPTPEHNGGLPQPTPRPAIPTHRRTASTDLNIITPVISTTLPDPCESPKQPQRTKKKQAPRPPQGRPVSTHGSMFGHNGPETTSLSASQNAGTSHSASGSPEQQRSNTPPRDGHPAPAARLHHSNSLRRPTAEPPKPPGAPAKPPRPSPPAFDALEKQEAKEGVALGFENVANNASGSSSGDECEVTLRRGRSGSGHLGFNVDGEKEEGGGMNTSQSFRKSLENVLQQQASGQPHPMPRHPHAESSATTTTVNSSTLPRPARPPTPAQRTTIPPPAAHSSLRPVTRDATQTSAAPDKPDQKPEKPALPEKPTLAAKPPCITSTSASVGGDHKTSRQNIGIASTTLQNTQVVPTNTPSLSTLPAPIPPSTATNTPSTATPIPTPASSTSSGSNPLPAPVLSTFQSNPKLGTSPPKSGTSPPKSGTSPPKPSTVAPPSMTPAPTPNPNPTQSSAATSQTAPPVPPVTLVTSSNTGNPPAVPQTVSASPPSTTAVSASPPNPTTSVFSGVSTGTVSTTVALSSQGPVRTTLRKSEGSLADVEPNTTSASSRGEGEGCGDECRGGGGGGVKVVVEATHTAEKQQPVLVNVNPQVSDARGNIGSTTITINNRPAVPVKPPVLPRPPSLSLQDSPHSPKHPPIPSQGSGPKSSGSGKFVWPPVQDPSSNTNDNDEPPHDSTNL